MWDMVDEVVLMSLEDAAGKGDTNRLEMRPGRLGRVSAEKEASDS